MSGPHADQPIRLDPREVAECLDIYRAHRPDRAGKCRLCRVENCPHRASARARLRMGGIDPEKQP